MYDVHFIIQSPVQLGSTTSTSAAGRARPSKMTIDQPPRTKRWRSAGMEFIVTTYCRTTAAFLSVGKSQQQVSIAVSLPPSTEMVLKICPRLREPNFPPVRGGQDAESRNLRSLFLRLCAGCNEVTCPVLFVEERPSNLRALHKRRVGRPEYRVDPCDHSHLPYETLSSTQLCPPPNRPKIRNWTWKSQNLREIASDQPRITTSCRLGGETDLQEA